MDTPFINRINGFEPSKKSRIGSKHVGCIAVTHRGHSFEIALCNDDARRYQVELKGNLLIYSNDGTCETTIPADNIAWVYNKGFDPRKQPEAQPDAPKPWVIHGYSIPNGSKQPSLQTPILPGDVPCMALTREGWLVPLERFEGNRVFPYAYRTRPISSSGSIDFDQDDDGDVILLFPQGHEPQKAEEPKHKAHQPTHSPISELHHIAGQLDERMRMIEARLSALESKQP